MNPSVSEDWGGEIPVYDSTMYNVFSETAAKFPNKIALVAMHQPSDLYGLSSSSMDYDYLRLTYAELFSAAETLAASLNRRGLSKGMPLASCLYNGVEVMLSQLAAFSLGCPFVPINPRTLTNLEEIEHMLGVTRTKGLVLANLEMQKTLETAIAGIMSQMVITSVVECSKLSGTCTPFSSLLGERISKTDANHSAQDISSPDDTVCILFTSGTTSLPKACPSTNRALVTNCLYYDKVPPETAKFISVMPNNHGYSIMYNMMNFIRGATVVYPGSSFSSQEVLRACEKEQCTDFACVPTMVHMLRYDIQSRGLPSLNSLRRVTVGGTSVTAEILRQSQFNTQVKVGTGFGMTEGSPIHAGYHSDANTLKRGETVSAGKANPGVYLRVCEPGDTRPVPRGQPGELHQSGPHMFSGYIGKARHEDWCIDEAGREWFRTGDQAIMETDGSIIICGRYKDIIIRGGENISPSVIEAVINKSEGIEAYVVPAPDPFAGEVPIAVIKTHQEFSTNNLQAAVSLCLGPAYVPEGFLSLADLQLDDFPRTTTGKVKKTEIARLVRKYRASLEPSSESVISAPSSRKSVLRIWSSLLGIEASHMSLDLPVQNFADSITVMRFRQALQKQTGKSLSVEEITENPTIEAQIALIDRKQVENVIQGSTATKRTRNGPPMASDMAHAAGDEQIAELTKQRVEDVLRRNNLTYDDVEDIIPAYDQAQILYKTKRDRSWEARVSVVTEAHDIEHVRSALERALRNSPMSHSFMVRLDEESEDDIPVYVTIRPSRKWFDKIITAGGDVANEDELAQFCLNDPSIDRASVEGPHSRWHILHLGSDKIGLVHTWNHSGGDALSQRLFCEDLEQALREPGKDLAPHEDYKLWSDSYYEMRRSPQAERETKWHVKRLSGLASHSKGLFPFQRAPEWFHGSSLAGWQPSGADLERNFQNPTREGLNKGWCTDDANYGDLYFVHLPSLSKLRESQPSLTGPVVLKTALALLNVYHTSHTHALFSSLEASRSTLPFFPESLATRLAINCADVAGPTFETVVDLIQVRPEEKVSSMLSRLQDEQILLTRYAAAPKLEIAARLDRQGKGAGDVIADVVRRQIFNWVPGLGAAVAGQRQQEFASFRYERPWVRMDEGLCWWAGLGGEDASTCVLKAIWDDANIKDEEAREWVEQLGKITVWITNEDNWEREVGMYRECLAK